MYTRRGWRYADREPGLVYTLRFCRFCVRITLHVCWDIHIPRKRYLVRIYKIYNITTHSFIPQSLLRKTVLIYIFEIVRRMCLSIVWNVWSQRRCCDELTGFSKYLHSKFYRTVDRVRSKTILSSLRRGDGENVSENVHDIWVHPLRTTCCRRHHVIIDARTL